LIVATKGIGQRYRHLMLDLRVLLPHSKHDQKCDPRELPLINEICEIKGCTSAIIFEARRRGDLYLWITKTPSGPSIKFHVQNVHTMKELKFTGNCLKGSRPIVSFDETFDSTPHYRLMKEVFKHVFPTPNYHPKSKPFIDHCINFYIHDGRIWFRNYQITGEQAEETTALVEIGPHFVLNPIKILSGSFFGTLLWENPQYVSPAAIRGMRKLSTAQSHHVNAIRKEISLERIKSLEPFKNPLDTLFHYDERTLNQSENTNKFGNSSDNRTVSVNSDENRDEFGSESDNMEDDEEEVDDEEEEELDEEDSGE